MSLTLVGRLGDSDSGRFIKIALYCYLILSLYHNMYLLIYCHLNQVTADKSFVMLNPSRQKVLKGTCECSGT